jgi:hypothetical protein
MDLVIYVLAFIGALTLVVLFLPTPKCTQEQVRLEREAADASWRIHQQAIDAFGQLLDAARSGEQEKD